MNRFADDLRQNAEEHERVGRQIADLAERLRVLEEDREMLLGLQDAVSGTQPAPTSEVEASRLREVDDRPVPSARAESPPQTSERTGTAGEPVSSKGEELREAKVTDLVEGCLREHGAPMSAAEVAEKVSTGGRPISVISVRTALEGLVRRSVAFRTKQGRAVFYAHSAAVSPSA